MVEIEIKTLGNFIMILFKNIFEIIELKILTSNVTQHIIVKYNKISNALKCLAVAAYTISDLEAK